MKISAVVKCQILDEELLVMTQDAIKTIRPYVDELILVDQASVVGSDYLQGAANIYIRNEQSTGFPGTAKQGMEASTGDRVAILNNDILFDGDWSTPLATMLTDDDVGLVHPKMLDWNQPFNCGNATVYNPPPQQGMFFSAFMLDKNIYNKIGGWDTDYDFWGYDDWDYYYRLRKYGYDAIWTDKVCYRHKGGATIGKIGREQFIETNKKLFIMKHGRNPHDIDWNYL